MTQSKKSVLYARVSTKEQADEGYSLPSQVKLLKEYAFKKDIKIAKQFTISESASGKQMREKFNEMMSYVQDKNIKIILVEKVDRLTRNFKDAIIVNDWLEQDENRQVHFVKQGLVLHANSKSNDKFQWDIHLVLARNYINNLSEEVKKGQLEKLKQGWYPCKPPLGYKTIGEKGHKIHVQDKNTAHYIQKMYKLYATGNYTISKLVEIMYEHGLRSKTGKRIEKSRIHGMLRDCFYCGKMTWNNIEYQAKHEPILSQDLWQKVQDVLTRENSGGKYRKHFYYLRGLISCGLCNYSITAEKQKGHVYYHCTGFDKICNNRKYVQEQVLEDQLLQGFDKIQIKNQRLLNWVKKALKESHADEMSYHNKCFDSLNKRYNQIQKRLDMLYDDKLDGKITEDFYNRKFKQYSEEQDAILIQLKKHKNSNINYFELGSLLLEVASRSAEIFKKAQDQEKRELINLVFSNLSLNGEELRYSYKPAFKILANRALAINSIFEPSKIRLNKAKTGVLNPEIEPWLRG